MSSKSTLQSSSSPDGQTGRTPDINDGWEQVEKQKTMSQEHSHHHHHLQQQQEHHPHSHNSSTTDSLHSQHPRQVDCNSEPPCADMSVSSGAQFTQAKCNGSLTPTVKREPTDEKEFEVPMRSGGARNNTWKDFSFPEAAPSHKFSELIVCDALSSDDEPQECAGVGLSALGSPPRVAEISLILAAKLPAATARSPADNRHSHQPLNAFCEPVEFMKCDSMDGFTQICFEKSYAEPGGDPMYAYLRESQTVSLASSSDDLEQSYENVNESLLSQSVIGHVDNQCSSCNSSITNTISHGRCESHASPTDFEFSGPRSPGERESGPPFSPNSRTPTIAETPKPPDAPFTALEKSLAACGPKHASKSNEFIRLALPPTLQTFVIRDTKNPLNHAPPIQEHETRQPEGANHDNVTHNLVEFQIMNSLPLPSSPPPETQERNLSVSGDTTISLDSESSQLYLAEDWSRASSINSVDSESPVGLDSSRGNDSSRSSGGAQVRGTPREQQSGKYSSRDPEQWYYDNQYREEVCLSPRRARHGGGSAFPNGRPGRPSHRPLRYRDRGKGNLAHQQGSHSGIEKDRGGGVGDNGRTATRSRILAYVSNFWGIAIYGIVACTLTYIGYCMIFIVYNAGKCRFEYGGEISLRVQFHPLFYVLPVPEVACGAGIAQLEQIIEIGNSLGKTLITREDIILNDYYDDLEELLMEFNEMDLGEISTTETSAYQRERTQRSQQRPPCDSAQVALELKSGGLPAACRIPIIEGLAHINDTLQTIYSTVQEFRVGVMAAAGRLARGLIIVEQQLVGDIPTAKSGYFKFFDYSVPNYKKLVSAFSEHLFNEVKSIQGLAESIFKQLESASARTDSTLALLRTQLDIVLNVGEATQLACYHLELFDIFGGKILRRISEKLGFRICDGTEKEQAERVSTSKNITSTLLLKAENQAMQAHGVISRVLKSLHSFEGMLKRVEETPFRFLSFYSEFHREERSKVIDKVKALRILFQEQSGERTLQLTAGSTRTPSRRRPAKAVVVVEL